MKFKHLCFIIFLLLIKLGEVDCWYLVHDILHCIKTEVTPKLKNNLDTDTFEWS